MSIVMFDNLCSLPLSSDLFAQAIHPSEPLVAVGLASGHVQTYRLPPLADSNGTSVSDAGYGAIETSWRTKRHKGSCRSLSFGYDGESVFSTGTDGIVKIAATETGQVSSKIRVPLERSRIDAPSLIHVLSPQSLLLATDSSALHIYDLRTASRPQQTHHPHDDYISSLTPLPPTGESTSGFSKQWISTGGTTLAVTDLRRGVLVKSEDQEEELFSSVFVSGLPTKANGSKGEKILVGDGNGVLTLWEKGVWDDQEERIIVDRGGPKGKESLDSLTRVPEGVGQGIQVAVGLGNGTIKIVRLGVNKVVAELSHDEVESVLTLGFTARGRMISGGGQVVKVWQESVDDGVNDDDDEEKDSGLKRRNSEDSEEGDSEDEGQDSSDAEEQSRKKRKKRKRAKGKDHGGGQHVMAFKGMD